MAVACIFFEIKRDIDRKRKFVISLLFSFHDYLEPLEYFPTILIQTAQVPKVLGMRNYCRKVQCCG